MKNIFFILILCIIKLNAYEYEIQFSGSYQSFLLDERTNILEAKRIRYDGVTSYSSNNAIFFELLNYIGKNNNFVNKNEFRKYYVNDLNFLNDLYLQKTNPILNYLYNPNSFSSSNYINYENYELLYNSEGLAVESIVNGVWRGLYDGPDNSGYLYNEKDDLMYINGVPVSFFQRINNKLMKRFKINLESIFMKKIFYPLLVLIFACVILRAVIRMAVKAFLIRFYDNKIRRLEKRRENIENA